MKAALLLANICAGILLGMAGWNLLAGLGFVTAAIAIRITIALLSSSNNITPISASRLHFIWPAFLFAGIGIATFDIHSPQPGYFSEDETMLLRMRVEQRLTIVKGERYKVEVNSILHGNSSQLQKCTHVSGYFYTDAMTVLKPGDIVDSKASVKNLDNASPSCVQILIFQERGSEVMPVGHHEDIFSVAAGMREKISILIERSPLSMDARSLIKGLLIAERGELGERRLSYFRDAGMSHMLAVSGLHIGIISAILLWLTRPLTLVFSRSMRYIVVIIAVWSFAFLTGLGYSTMRACMMLTLATIAVIIERSREGFSCVCVAGILILIISPGALTDVGFQLSFTCVAALCLFAERLNPVNHHEHPHTHSICSALLTTIVATGATWMISGYHFSTVPTNFLVANIIILPFLPAYMVVAILYLTILSMGFDISFAATIINHVTDWIYRFLTLFSGTSVELPINVTSLTLWMIGIVLLATSLNINPGKTQSGAVISQSVTTVSLPWLYAALLTLAASLLALILL